MVGIPTFYCELPKSCQLIIILDIFQSWYSSFCLTPTTTFIVQEVKFISNGFLYTRKIILWNSHIKDISGTKCVGPHMLWEMSREVPSPQTGKLTSIICRIHQKQCGLIDTDAFREGNTLCSSYSLQAIAFIMIWGFIQKSESVIPHYTSIKSSFNHN